MSSKVLALAVALVLVSQATSLVTAGSPQATQTEAPASAAGEWNINLEANQPQPFRGAMDQQGAKLSGYMGDEIAEYPLTGTVQGATITFTWSMFQRGEEIKIVVTGKLEKDNFTGTAKIGNYASSVAVTGQRTPPTK